MDSQPLTTLIVSKLDTESCISKKGMGIIFELELLPFKWGSGSRWNYSQFPLSEPCHGLFFLPVFHLWGPMNFIPWIRLIRDSCLSFSLGAVPAHHSLLVPIPRQVSIFLPACWSPHHSGSPHNDNPQQSSLEFRARSFIGPSHFSLASALLLDFSQTAVEGSRGSFKHLMSA